ncbi:hypothetical protein [Acidipropionibacterium acidipropionici]|uniref:hypothetical protein n=1 Tax=Acidipropionibacterium acidipropionici TaxID=1748 RepID=UPI00042083C6|nr:hypothetical protein [Acidipropionibacterium acidipropionici]ALN14354.1 hypothetical protein ASQ49_02685 [Acidipropionibacterium acidipropionici]APZ09883.1 hypothetical protein BWX38_12265 [Acidipropionibacterium acidipropionici]
MTDQHSENATPPSVNVTVEVPDRGGSETHGWKVLGTLLVVGGVSSLSWALAKSGLLELASTMLTMMLVQLVRLLFTAGMISMPERKGGAEAEDFAETKGVLKKAWSEFQIWQARSSVLRLALLAAGYTLAFMLLKLLLQMTLKVFTNIWVALAFGAIAAAVIVSPGLFKSAIGGLKSRVKRD